jgi:hypothetical protein
MIAWPTPSRLPDPPAGQSERQLDPQPTVDNGDEDD